MSELTILVKKFKRNSFSFLVLGILLAAVSASFGWFVTNNSDKVAGKFTVYVIRDINDRIEKRTHELAIEKQFASTDKEIQMISEIERLLDFILAQNERTIKAMFQIVSLSLFVAGLLVVIRSISDLIFVKKLQKYIN